MAPVPPAQLDEDKSGDRPAQVEDGASRSDSTNYGSSSEHQIRASLMNLLSQQKRMRDYTPADCSDVQS